MVSLRRYLFKMATCTSTDSDPNSHPETDLSDKEATQPGKYQLQEGHEISFVKQPPKEIQLECSICLQFLSDPCHSDCECGNSFCRACIETIEEMNNPCPLCNERFGIIIPSKQLKRTLNSLQIYCTHKDEGCEWIDELGRLSDHFNVSPTVDSRIKGCELTPIACRYCNKHIPRRDIPNHEANLCPDKPYTCQYCDYSSIYNDITDNHWHVCVKFPVPCPYECGETPERQNLEAHVVSECGVVPTECDFNYIGCKVELPRKDMPAHLKDNMVEHMSLLALSHRKEHITLCAERREADTKNTKEVQAIKQSLLSMQLENMTLKKRITSLELENMTLKTESQRSVEQLRSHLCLLPVRFKMNNFRQLRRNDDTWDSPPFYTHDQGYKMCLEVEPNGSGDGYGTHLSVFVCLMKGEFDSMLNWPFRGVVTYKLLDQRLGRHVTDVLEFDDSSDDCAERVFSDDTGPGWGCDTFKEYKYLPPNFLHNDCLQFEVAEVEVH